MQQRLIDPRDGGDHGFARTLFHLQASAALGNELVGEGEGRQKSRFDGVGSLRIRAEVQLLFDDRRELQEVLIRRRSRQPKHLFSHR